MGTRSAVKRRVVVTGMGAVSPNGIGREAFWNATRRGQSGVRRITRFDASRHQVQIAGEVTDFDESAFVEPKERQHVSRAVPLAIAAAREAVTDAGIEPQRMSREQLQDNRSADRVGRRFAGIYRGTISALLQRAREAMQRVYDSHFDDRHAGE